MSMQTPKIIHGFTATEAGYQQEWLGSAAQLWWELTLTADTEEVIVEAIGSGETYSHGSDVPDLRPRMTVIETYQGGLIGSPTYRDLPSLSNFSSGHDWSMPGDWPEGHTLLVGVSGVGDGGAVPMAYTVTGLRLE